ncbi:hypothetical protein BZA05DRAFT_474176 [Tricharina praecox]|uniref:uncharacterized protein n=1 Tax=Tricharina praecox TaxID=43433 RepID=UPI00221FE35D|nr:uncharacterized protein BZA05DRAFT_474176 [Tricharina praecox]KAI5850837.1 hypothetical protein BZA05DRAFT_474176 [Tricharina praecox]
MSSSHFVTSFSSAAAGKDTGNSNHHAANSSGGSGNSGGGGGGGVAGSGSGDWSRRVNGAVSNSTTRRPSLSTTLTHNNNAASTVPLTSAASNVYHPPHHYNRQAVAAPGTYGKDELLSLFRVQESGGSMGSKLADLVDTDFGGSATASGGWGRSGDEATNGVDMCWEKDGGLKPVSLEDMTEEEREFFAANVNSALKVPNNNNNINPNTTQGIPNNHGTPPPNRNKAPGVGVTPGSSRPTTRRRDTSDAGLSGNPFTNATPPQIARRRTDLRGEGDEVGSPVRDRTFFGRWGTNPGPGEDEMEKKDDGSVGGSVGRNTGLFRRGSGAAWGSTGSGSALNSPMGTFGGAFGGGPMGGFALQSGDKPKGAQKGAPGGSAHPKVEDVDERAEEDDHRSQQPHSEGTDDGDRERPMTSDTDPFGHGGASRDEQQQQQHSHDDRNSPLPTPGLQDQQRMKASPFGPGAGISISTSGQPRIGSAIGTPTKQRSDLGAFGAFGGSREGLGGMGTLGMSGLHHQLQNLTFNQQGQVPLRRSREGSIGNALAGDNEPLSPAETNPFQSPPPEKVDDDGMLHDNSDGGGLGSVIAGLRKGESHVGAPGSDRSGRSSTAGLGSVGGGGLGGFGGLSGPSLWGGGQASTPGIGSSGTPNSFFGGGLGDLSSPGGLAGGGLLSGGIGGLGGSSHFGSASRSSRLGQLFPENQHQDDGQGGYDQDTFGGDSRFVVFGSRNRGFGSINDSPMRERGDVADLFGFPSARSLSNLAGTAASQENPMFARDRDDSVSALHQAHQQQDSPLGAGVQTPGGQPLRPPPGTLPPQPQHVMIMPDKIQWVYRDPSGVIQGPFSGLEMHEWYRAGFFTPDLAVKRQEDGDFEQLGTLVRKIGNTREPFLVPLPGNTSAGMSTNAANWSGSWLNEMPGAQQQAQQQAQQVQQQQQAVQTPGGVQPPFAGSFPTFGTTLTAEQQNALERRKQEEQYLMAKQREFLLQQQMMAKQAAVAQQLHHQSSTQSLHSQPSFGSLHSPSGFAPTAAPAVSAATIIGGQNSFEPGALLRQAGAAAGGVGGHGVDAQLAFAQQFVQPHPPQQDQQSLLMQQQQQQQQKFAEQQRQQLQKSYQNQQSQHAEKLQQAQEQAQQVAAQIQQSHMEPQEEQSAAHEQHSSPSVHQETFSEAEAAPVPKAKTPVPEQLAVKSQTPKVASQKTSPVSKPAHLAWGGQHAHQPTPLVQPFPPPPGREPSPTSTMARSPSVETPSAPSIAPWAKEIETPLKGPSLKEIQELEAKQAAVREAAEAEARRHALSQQVFSQPPPPAPGLPSTATWATSPSTTPASGGMSAWNKPLAKAAPVSSGRKTLQQIQKEEEARKVKAAAAAASQAALTSTVVAAATGKRYADLASKAAVAPAQNPPINAAWTTVGPGGKSKNLGGILTPTTPATTVQPMKLSTSSLGFAPPAAAKKPTPPAAPSKPVATSAQEEFMKWCRASIKGLGAGVSPDQVIEMVVNFPSDAEIIADTIYAVSTTMDGRRWAEEYIKRRNAAGSGVVIEAGAGGNSAGSGGGWNEVAKSRPAAPAVPVAGTVPESSASFRVVAGKKKGRR